MNTQFPFTSAGVQRWQDELNQLGSNAISYERWQIENNFMDWLVSRFLLTAEQIAYAEDLGAYTHRTYAVTISNALAQGTPIILDKDTTYSPSADKSYENPKVTEIRDRIRGNSSDAPSALETDHVFERSLVVHIYYEQISD